MYRLRLLLSIYTLKRKSIQCTFCSVCNNGVISFDNNYNFAKNRKIFKTMFRYRHGIIFNWQSLSSLSSSFAIIISIIIIIIITITITITMMMMMIIQCIILLSSPLSWWEGTIQNDKFHSLVIISEKQM